MLGDTVFSKKERRREAACPGSVRTVWKCVHLIKCIVGRIIGRIAGFNELGVSSQSGLHIRMPERIEPTEVVDPFA